MLLVLIFHLIELKLSKGNIMYVQVWFDNVPHASLDRGNQNAVSKKGDKLVFSRDGPQSIRDMDKYLDQISKVCCIIIVSRFMFYFLQSSNLCSVWYRWFLRLHLANIHGLL